MCMCVRARARARVLRVPRQPLEIPANRKVGTGKSRVKADCSCFFVVHDNELGQTLKIYVVL